MDPLLLEILVTELADELVGSRVEKIRQYDDYDLALRSWRSPRRATLVVAADPDHPVLAWMPAELAAKRSSSPLVEAARARLRGARLDAIDKYPDERKAEIGWTQRRNVRHIAGAPAGRVKLSSYHSLVVDPDRARETLAHEANGSELC